MTLGPMLMVLAWLDRVTQADGSTR